MRKSAYILLAAVGMTACNYLEIEPVGQVIPHKTSEFRALLTTGYYAYPFGEAQVYTCLLSDEVGMLDASAFLNASDAVPLATTTPGNTAARCANIPISTSTSRSSTPTP